MARMPSQPMYRPRPGNNAKLSCHCEPKAMPFLSRRPEPVEGAAEGQSPTPVGDCFVRYVPSQ
jgi:hypothetical protein